MMYSDDLQCAELRQLLANETENEVIEFKAAKNQFDVDAVGRYFSALSNAAHLAGRPKAWLVLGVDDRRQPVGTQAFATPESLNALKRQLSEASNGHSLLRILDCSLDGVRVLALVIPPAPPGLPVSWKGHYYNRAGESLVALSIESLERIRNPIQGHTAENSAVAQGLSDRDVAALLDVPAYMQHIRGYDRRRSEALELADRLALFEQEGFIAGEPDARTITRLGAVLWSHDLRQFDGLARCVLRLVVYGDGQHLRIDRLYTRREIEFTSGYALAFPDLVATLAQQLPQFESIQGASRRVNRSYPELALRELAINALVHQDLTVRGASPMISVFADRVEFTNPGEPLPHPDRFIDTPPQSRNEKLARFMRRLGFCEERGSGIDKVISLVEAEHLPPPLFEKVEGFTRVLLFGPRPWAQTTRAERLRACYQHACLRYESNQQLTNASLQARFGVADSSAISRLIRDCLHEGWLVEADPDNRSRRYSSYLPYWAKSSR